MKKHPRLCTALLSAALAGLLALGGCGPQEPLEIDEPVLPKNDGAPAKLTIGIEGRELEVPTNKSGDLERVMEDIIAKYRADFPNTEISFTDSPDADIRLFSSDSAAGADWLMDLSPYEDAWTGEGTISNPANRIMRFMGGDEIYAIPCSYDEIMLYYRWDWFHEYNLDYVDDENAKAAVHVWDRLLRVEDQLGDRGRLAISEDIKPWLFDAMLWSFVRRADVADASLAYYQPDGSTIFTLDRALKAVETYEQVMDKDMGADDPIQAFIDGQAGMYIGSGRDGPELEEKMEGVPGEDWYAVGLPTGDSGRTAPLLGWSAWGVNKDTSEPEKAVHFLWYLTNADNNTHMYAQLRSFGVKPIYRETEAYDPGLADGCWYGELELLNTSGYRYYSAPLIFGTETGAKNPVFTGLLKELESGEITPRELLQGLDGEYKELLNEYTAGGSLPWADMYMEVEP